MKDLSTTAEAIMQSSPLFDASKFVETWLQKSGLSFNVGGSLMKGGQTMSTDEALNNLAIDYQRLYYLGYYNAKINKLFAPPKFTDKDLHTALKAIRRNSINTQKEALIKSLAYEDYGTEDPVKDFIYAIGKNPSPLDVAVFKHFIWQVKRKLLNMPVTYHMMINFYGDQKLGKTTTLRKICSPLAALTAERSFIEILDERNKYFLELKYINIVEELSRAGAADLESLKTLITKDIDSARILGKNEHSDYKQNCTFLGSSNKHISEVIYDDTGMRRFYELMVTDDTAKHWGYVDQMDVVKLWKSVDPNTEPHILPFMKELEVHQEKLRQKSPVEQFLEDNPYEVTQEYMLAWPDFCKEYIDYCREFTPIRNINRQNLMSKLERLIPGVGLVKMGKYYINLKKSTKKTIDKELA